MLYSNLVFRGLTTAAFREDPISVVMFDTWGPTDVDLNLEVYLRLMAPRLPPVGRIGVAYLSHICGDGLLRLQIPGPGLGILNSCMDAVNNYFKVSTPSSSPFLFFMCSFD